MLTPTIEEREGQDAIEFEDDKKEVAKMTTKIEELVTRYVLTNTVIIKDDTDTPLPNNNILAEEEIQSLMKDSRKLCKNPNLLQITKYPMLEVKNIDDTIVTPVI